MNKTVYTITKVIAIIACLSVLLAGLFYYQLLSAFTSPDNSVVDSSSIGLVALALVLFLIPALSLLYLRRDYSPILHYVVAAVNLVILYRCFTSVRVLFGW